MSTASFPTSIPSFGLIETEPLKVERIAREVEAIATKVGIGTRVGTDISATGNVAVGNGTYYEIGSLSGNIVLTFQTTGATEGTEITLVRTGTTAHTITCNNGGTDAGTMAILPASTAGVASFVYMNANWRLKHVSLGMAVTKRTCTIDFAPGADNFAGLAGGVKTFSKNIGAATPANARLVGWSIGETITQFDDATHGDFDLEIGTAGDPNAIMTSTSVKAGATNFPKNGTAGVAGFNMCPIASTQYIAKLTGSVDLNTTTAGAIVVNLFYLVLA